MEPGLEAFWSFPPQELLAKLGSTASGLCQEEARARLATYGPNTLKPRRRLTTFALLIAQYQSPIILILIFAATLSFFLGDRPDATIILVIVLISGLLAFWQEKEPPRRWPGFSPWCRSRPPWSVGKALPGTQPAGLPDSWGGVQRNRSLHHRQGQRNRYDFPGLPGAARPSQSGCRPKH